MNNYDYQKEANISCLLEDEEYKERKDAFFNVIKTFQQNNIEFGVACSFNLFLRGIVDEFHDLDLIVDSKDIEKVKGIMSKLGASLIATGGNGYCESNVYLHYQLDRIDLDIISGFKILTFGTSILYEYNSSEVEICSIYEEDEFNIPLISAEAMFLLYCMMEGWQPRRRYKRVLLEEYVKNVGEKFPNVFGKFLNDNLPGWVKREMRGIRSFNQKR